MASTEIDQKFLGKLAKAVEQDNPLLASMLFKILGLSLNLSEHTIRAKKQRRTDPTVSAESVKLHLHIIWLSREGLVMLEQYVLPMVGNYGELKVLAYKLRASFYHIFAHFHNVPPITSLGLSTPEIIDSAAAAASSSRPDKGKGPAYPLDGGPVGPPPGFGPEAVGSFIMPAQDYLPKADKYFRDAIEIAEENLWGSHSLRVSVKTEYAGFLYECLHNAEASRKLAKATIGEVYEAKEGIDNDMFDDACELVTVLGKIMKRGRSNNTLRSGGQAGSSVRGTPRTEVMPDPVPPIPHPPPVTTAATTAPPGQMPEFI